jgi:hypothetical protein
MRRDGTGVVSACGVCTGGSQPHAFPEQQGVDEMDVDFDIEGDDGPGVCSTSSPSLLASLAPVISLTSAALSAVLSTSVPLAPAFSSILHPATITSMTAKSIAIPGASSTLIIKKSCSPKTVPVMMRERTATQNKTFSQNHSHIVVMRFFPDAHATLARRTAHPKSCATAPP